MDRLGEFGFIRRVTQGVSQGGALVGTGDDCAVLPPGDAPWLVSCDASVEGVHFRLDWSTPRDAGWKAAAGAISDIAAMGGVPRFMLAAVAAPAARLEDELAEFCAGIAEAAERFGAALVGGDVTRSPGPLFADITVLGSAPGGRYLTRSAALAGDALAVTGWPGRAASGLDALAIGLEAPVLTAAQRRPEPRLAQGRWLAGRAGVHAAIDLSDGLAQDAGHIAERSGLTLALRGDWLPHDPEIERFAARWPKPPVEYVLRGGESYELAVSLAAEDASRIVQAFEAEFGMPLTIVGSFSAGECSVTLDGKTIEQGGFDHFGDAAG